MPKDGFNDESIANLKLLVESKATLIKKALGAENLNDHMVEDDKISFPWFSGSPAPDEISAYAKFIGKLLRYRLENQKRVTAKDKDVDRRLSTACPLFSPASGLHRGRVQGRPQNPAEEPDWVLRFQRGRFRC